MSFQYKIWTRVRAVLAFTLCSFSWVYALSLSEPVVSSYLGEPLHAELLITDQAEGSISLASTAEYLRMGYPQIPHNISLRSLDNKVILTTDDTVDEAAFNVLLEVIENDNQKRIIDVAILLDPPDSNNNTVSNTNAQAVGEDSGQVAGAVVKNKPVETSSNVPKPKPDTTASKDSQPIQQPDSVKKDMTTETAKTEKTQQKTKVTYKMLGKTYGPVKRDQTLWSIADQNKPEGVKTQAMVAAIRHTNPKAFVNGVLKEGAVLNLPDPRTRKEIVTQVPVVETTVAKEAIKQKAELVVKSDQVLVTDQSQKEVVTAPNTTEKLDVNNGQKAEVSVDKKTAVVTEPMTEESVAEEDVLAQGDGETITIKKLPPIPPEFLQQTEHEKEQQPVVPTTTSAPEQPKIVEQVQQQPSADTPKPVTNATAEVSTPQIKETAATTQSDQAPVATTTSPEQPVVKTEAPSSDNQQNNVTPTTAAEVPAKKPAFTLAPEPVVEENFLSDYLLYIAAGGLVIILLGGLVILRQIKKRREVAQAIAELEQTPFPIEGTEAIQNDELSPVISNNIVETLSLPPIGGVTAGTLQQQDDQQNIPPIQLNLADIGMPNQSILDKNQDVELDLPPMSTSESTSSTTGFELNLPPLDTVTPPLNTQKTSPTSAGQAQPSPASTAIQEPEGKVLDFSLPSLDEIQKRVDQAPQSIVSATQQEALALDGLDFDLPKMSDTATPPQVTAPQQLVSEEAMPAFDMSGINNTTVDQQVSDLDLSTTLPELSDLTDLENNSMPMQLEEEENVLSSSVPLPVDIVEEIAPVVKAPEDNRTAEINDDLFSVDLSAFGNDLDLSSIINDNAVDSESDVDKHAYTFNPVDPQHLEPLDVGSLNTLQTSFVAEDTVTTTEKDSVTEAAQMGGDHEAQQIKLDLAEAYMDFDPALAKPLLEEVVNEGSQSQIDKAKQLLSQLS